MQKYPKTGLFTVNWFYWKADNVPYDEAIDKILSIAQRLLDFLTENRTHESFTHPGDIDAVIGALTELAKALGEEYFQTRSGCSFGAYKAPIIFDKYPSHADTSSKKQHAKLRHPVCQEATLTS